MPAREGGQQKKTYKGEDDGDDAVAWSACAADERRMHVHEVGEDDVGLERAGDPDEIQWILIDADLSCQTAGIVAAQPSSTVRVDADAKVADAGLQLGMADDVGNGRRDAGVDL